jgi:GMP synthase (glutamine-hydrolysing)
MWKGAPATGTFLRTTLSKRGFATVNVTKKGPLRFLVVDGYSKEGRADLVKGGASQAGWLYRDMLNKASPIGATSDIVYPADDEFKQPDLKVYDGVAWTGCSLTIYHTEDPRVQKQISLANHVFENNLPSFGSCWAIQIAAVAAGGKCDKNPKGREMGIARKIHLTQQGVAHPMYEGKPKVFDAFISHNDEVTHIPPSGILLAGNQWTRVQGLSVAFGGGHFWAVQYHPEYDLHELARLTYCRRQVLTDQGFFKSLADADAYVQDLEDLHKDPKRKDLWWKLGIDEDVISEDIRHCEVRNWIRHLVLPYSALRNVA